MTMRKQYNNAKTTNYAGASKATSLFTPNFLKATAMPLANRFTW